jgi:flagellar assembly factor FliW
MTPLLSTRPLVDRQQAVSDELPLEITRDAVRFPNGLPGFEACRSFVLMQNDALGPLQLLKATEGPAASFLVIDPRRVLPEYRCDLSQADRHRLGVGANNVETLLWLVLVTIELDGTITANLRAPVVINPENMVGHQVVPHDCVYPIRHVIAAGE